MSARSSAARATAPVRTGSRRPSLTAIPGAGGRSRLEAVRAPLQASSRVPFLVLCMVILVGALVAALLLNVAMVRGSYEQTELNRDVAHARQDIETLQGELNHSKATLDEGATELGMVNSTPPRMVELSTGQVVGGTDDAGQ